MNTTSVRSVLAILVVGVFMLITAVLALFPVFSNKAVEMKEYADFFNKTSSVYTGIVGVIIGFYFGRNTDKIKDDPYSVPKIEIDG